MTDGYFSGLFGWRTTKKERKPGTLVKESELTVCIEAPVRDDWIQFDDSVSTASDLSSIEKGPGSSQFLLKNAGSELVEIGQQTAKSSPGFQDDPTEESKTVPRLDDSPYASVKFAKDWNFIEATDDYRVDYAHRKGGVPLADIRIQNKIRESGSEILKTMGRKILSGDFNLTTISFPIKCMDTKTVLHNMINAMLMDSLYINRAALLKDPVERLKLVVISKISCFIHTCTFMKPV